MKAFAEQISQAQTIAITGHIHPDGDCIGSCLGLRQYILDNFEDKKVDVYLETIAPEFLFLSGANEIASENTDKSYDLFFILDCSTQDRFAPFAEMVQQANMVFCIDHHISNHGLGDFCILDPKASATCELLCELFPFDQISKECAECLYTGIVHDTGVFKHSNTRRMTMSFAGQLTEKGINTSKIIDETFFQKTFIQNKALGQALINSVLLSNGSIVFSNLSEEELSILGAKPTDVNGIIDQLRVTKDVEVAVFTYPLKEGGYKVSMRSNGKVNVSVISQKYQGGGHIKAAGCTIFGTLNEVKEKIIPEIEKQL